MKLKSRKRSVNLHPAESTIRLTATLFLTINALQGATDRVSPGSSEESQDRYLTLQLDGKPAGTRPSSQARRFLQTYLAFAKSI